MTDTPDTPAPAPTDAEQSADQDMLKQIYAAIAGRPIATVTTSFYALLFGIAADPKTDEPTREALALMAMDSADNIRRVAGLTDERVAEIMATSSSEIVEVEVVDEP